MAFTVRRLLGILTNQNFGPWDMLLCYPKAVLLLVYIFFFFHDCQMEEIIKTEREKKPKFHGQKQSAAHDFIEAETKTICKELGKIIKIWTQTTS